MRLAVLSILLNCGFLAAEGYWAEPVKLPGMVNDTLHKDSIGNHYHAHLSPDGTELYFTREDYHYNDDIYVARYNKEAGVWDSVTRLSVNMDDSRRELSPSITADHSKLFWCRWGLLPGSYGGYDVWYAEWDSVAQDWGEPKNAGPNVNTPGYEFTCFIAPDGKTLYVSSDWDSDCDDIYKHTWQDSMWGPRERVFKEMHPGTCEWDPWVSADGKWLYFSMWTGGYSIWRSRWEGEYFGDPEMLPEPVFVNGDHQWNFCPSLNPDGSRLYFSSNRPDSISQAAYLWYSEYLDPAEEQSYKDAFDLEVSPLSRNTITINYILPQSGQVFCGIFDTAGNLVRILASEKQTGGNHNILWNGVDDRGCKVPSGTYFIHLTVSRQKTTRKTIVIQ